MGSMNRRKHLTMEQVCWWWAGSKCFKSYREVRLMMVNKVRLGHFPKPSRKLSSNITLWALADLRKWLLSEQERLCGLRDRLIAWDREDSYGWWSDDRPEGTSDPAGDQPPGGVRGDPPGKAAPRDGAD
jgi:hypothetical protein